MNRPAVIMSSSLASALYKLQKYGEIMRCEDGYYRVPHKHWTISGKQMRDLVVLGHARVDTVGESVFAVALRRPE